MIRYKYILFDLDGTLIDTKDGVLSAVIQTLKKYNKAIPNKRVLESLIGPPMQNSLKQLYSMSDKVAMNMANDFRAIYMNDEYLYNANAYKGTLSLIKELSSCGAIVGVATYKREDYAIRLLCEKGFNKYIDYMYGSDFEGQLTKTDIIKKCLTSMSCKDRRNAVYIGDGDSDGKCSNEAGTKFIAVTYGYGFKRESDAVIYNPDGVANDCKALRALLFE